MIEEVREQHGIDVSRSVVIGDSFRDVEVEGNLRLRIHLFPEGKCDILSEHLCFKNLEQIRTKLLEVVEGSISNDHC